MSALILDGHKAASVLLEELRPKVKKLNPKLVVVQVGNDPASESYIRQKVKSCGEVGLRCEYRRLPVDVSFEELASVIQELNANSDVTGFIIQLPLPKHLHDREPEVIRMIEPSKDVDGFTAYNLGKMFLSTEFEHLPPATPGGIIALLEHYKIPIAGKNVTVVGRSNIVGKPIAVMLLNRDATVTVCHQRTEDLGQRTRDADILVSAVGKQNLITADMVKDEAVVIDVGIVRTENGLAGDVDFKAVKNKAFAITPVPGGVGPMTVASLIRNVVRAAERNRGGDQRSDGRNVAM